MIKLIIITLTAILITSCSSNSIKENINKAGDVAGQTAGEFIEGASKGVQKAFDVKIVISENLKGKGIEFGKTTVSSDSLGSDNLLIVYMIFNKDYDSKITAKVFEDQSQEMGRSVVSVKGKKDETKFIEFHFDKHTNIDSKNKLTIE